MTESDASIPSPADRREAGTAWLLRFQPDEPIGSAVRRMLTYLATEMISGLEAPERLGTDETIHDVRRHGKQARALLKLVHASAPEHLSAIDRNLRDAGRCLADARDAKVVLETFSSLGGDMAPSDTAAISFLLDTQATATAEAVFAEGDNAASAALALLSDASSLIISLERPITAEMVADGAARTYTAARRGRRRVRKRPTPERFHTWRKRVKDHRHHMAYLWECGPLEPMTHDELYELSDLLGDAHDLVVLDAHISHINGDIDPVVRAEIIDTALRLRTALEDQAVEKGASPFKARPSEFRAALGSRVAPWFTHES